jgi:hypothetical protein
MSRTQTRLSAPSHSPRGMSTILPRVTYEEVTPAIARDWLRHNVSNRPLRPSYVAELKGMFERGEYRVTHQGVGFGLDGVLQDGQHRLSALAQMPESFSVIMQVTRGLDKEAFSVHDMGKKRTYSDALRIPRGLAEVARLMADLAGGTGRMSPQYLKTYVDYFRPYYEQLLEDMSSPRRTWSTAPVRSAAIIQMARGIEADYVRHVYRALITADFNAMPPVAQAVFRAELNGRVKANDKNDIFARSLKIFNPDCANQTIVRIDDASTAVAEVREFINEALLNGRLRGI